MVSVLHQDLVVCRSSQMARFVFVFLPELLELVESLNVVLFQHVKARGSDVGVDVCLLRYLVHELLVQP